MEITDNEKSQKSHFTYEEILTSQYDGSTRNNCNNLGISVKGSSVCKPEGLSLFRGPDGVSIGAQRKEKNGTRRKKHVKLSINLLSSVPFVLILASSLTCYLIFVIVRKIKLLSPLLPPPFFFETRVGRRGGGERQTHEIREREQRMHRDKKYIYIFTFVLFHNE